MIKGKYNVLGLEITDCETNHLLDEIKTHIKNKKNLLIAALPVNQITIAYLDKRFGYLLNKFNYLIPDSVWVKRSINFLYNTKIGDRTRGTDLTLRICKMAEKERFKIFLFGSTRSTIRSLSNTLLTNFSKLQIVGILSPPFRDLTRQEKEKTVKVINKSKADLVFIALGTPKQEIFAYDLLYKNPRLDKPKVVIPVGAVFDFISGEKSQAPKWMQETGFEWLYRLFQEPRRLWKRYLIYGPMFFYLITKQKISSLIFKK